MTSTNIIWLEATPAEPIPNELRSHLALFTSEDACYQFISSLPPTLRGLTLVITDATAMPIDRLLQLKQISVIYLLASTGKAPLKPSAKVHGVFADRPALINQIIADFNRTKAPPPGFLTGIMAPFQGFHFLFTHPSTWPRALIPAVVFTLLLFLYAVPGVWGMHLLTDHLRRKYTARWIQYGLFLLRIVLYLVAMFVALILAFVTAQPLSAPALESLVRAQERQLKYPNRPEESFCGSVWRSVRVAIVSILASLGIILLLTFTELFFPPAVLITTPIKFLATALIIAYDLIDYPLSLHLLGVRERTPWFRHHLWATLGFGLAMEVIFLIPGAFLLLLPAGVCGATVLVVAAERAQIDQPLLLIENPM